MENLEFIYINYREELSTRLVVPATLWYGSTEYHKEPQHFLSAYDIKKEA